MRILSITNIVKLRGRQTRRLSLIALTMAIHVTAIVTMAFVDVRVRARLESRSLDSWRLVAALIFTSVVMVPLLPALHGAEWDLGRGLSVLPSEIDRNFEVTAKRGSLVDRDRVRFAFRRCEPQARARWSRIIRNVQHVSRESDSVRLCRSDHGWRVEHNSDRSSRIPSA